MANNQKTEAFPSITTGHALFWTLSLTPDAMTTIPNPQDALTGDGQMVSIFIVVLALFIIALVFNIIHRIRAEKKHSVLFNNAPVGIFQSTNDGRLIKANSEHARILGYSSPDELVKAVKNLAADVYANPDKRIEFKRRMEEFGRVDNFEVQVRCRDGKLKWIQLFAKNICKSTGSCHYEGFVTDITKRKEIEESLDKYRQLLDTSSSLGKIGGWEMDMATGRATWTRELFNIVEIDSGDPPGWEEHLNYYKPEHGKILQQALNRAVETNEPFDLTLQARTAKGNPLWCRVLGQAEFQNDKCVKLYGILQDITEQKKTETALTEKEVELQAILETVQAGILIIDVETRTIEKINNFAQDMLGASKEEIIGKTCHQFICPAQRGNCPILDHGREDIGAERVLVTAEGKRIPALKSAVPIRIGGRDMLLESFVDISRLKEIEESLLKAKESAESSNKSKGEFLANMSHEIRTPLNGVFGMLQLLQTTSLNSVQVEYVQTALDSSSSLLSVINDILDFSIIEANALNIVEEKFLIRETLQALTANFAFQAKKKGISLSCEVDPNIPKTVVGDSARIRQVLFNLVGNSLKFTEKGTIRIELTLLPDKRPDGSLNILFTVSDTGMGISDSLLPMLFEPFAQAEEARARRFNGTGLGLGIVKRLVNLMGGNVSIESEKGIGTTILFTINLKQDVDSLEKKEKVAPLSTAIRQRLNILLAEDDPTNRIVATRMLEKAGHSVTCASTGKQAVQLVRDNAFDCVLMDVQMPEMDGLEATRVIRSSQGTGRESSMPIIALTAHAMKGDRERFLSAGMDGYIAKPMEQGALLETLSWVFDSRRGKENQG